MVKYFFISYILFTVTIQAFGQDEYIYTKEGATILRSRLLIEECVRGMNKTKADKTALAICECQVSKIDGYFTKKQYRKHTNNGKIDLSGLIKEDTAIERQINECYTNSNRTFLIEAEGFENEFISNCTNSIKKNTEKKLDTNLVKKFCSCQLNLIKTKRISDAEMKTLDNPNSILFYEIMYKCGDPFATDETINKNWNANLAQDINGPLVDTIRVLALNGMTYLRVKTGSMSQFWLFDTGASDLLINKDMETQLKNESVIKEENYLGIAEYEMANGMIDSCRKYKIDNVQIGKFSVNNITVAVTDKGKRIIVGKGLLNKFSNWILNNKDNTLTLTK